MGYISYQLSLWHIFYIKSSKTWLPMIWIIGLLRNKIWIWGAIYLAYLRCSDMLFFETALDFGVKSSTENLLGWDKRSFLHPRPSWFVFGKFQARILAWLSRQQIGVSGMTYRQWIWSVWFFFLSPHPDQFLYSLSPQYRQWCIYV